MRRVMLVMAAIGMVATACGERAGQEVRDMADALDASAQKSRRFVYVDESLDGSQRIVVEGRIEDDFRYAGKVTVNGKPLYQQIVSDDAVALRLLDLERTASIVAAARRQDDISADALADGEWVVDFTGAPDTTRRPRATTSAISDDPVIDAARLLIYAGEAVRGAIAGERFNREDIEYNPLDDPWNDDDDEALEDEGIIRMDTRAPPLPRPAERGQTQSLPEVAHFRKIVVYVAANEAIGVREQLSFEDRREYRRASQGRTADFYLDQRDNAKTGSLDGTLRERRLDYEITFDNVEVRVPEDAVQGILGQATLALRELFEFEVVGRSNTEIGVETPEADGEASDASPEPQSG